MGKAPTIGYDYHDKMIVIHAVFGGLATMLLVPSAILIARYWRNNPAWYKFHSAINYLSTIFFIICFGVGTRAVASGGHPGQFEDSRTDVHHRIGLAVILLVLCQTIVGVIAHFTKAPADKPTVIVTTARSPIRLFHIFFGIATWGTSYAAVALGFDEWDSASDNATMTPRGVRIVYWILLALAIAAYLAGWVFHAKPIAESKQSSFAEEGMVEKH